MDEKEKRPSQHLRVFDGAVAIITGAASGIGRALSEELARRGASVVLADVQAEAARAAAANIPCAPGRRASACPVCGELLILGKSVIRHTQPASGLFSS